MLYARPALGLQAGVRRSEHLFDGDLLHTAIVVGTDVEQAGVTFHGTLEHPMLAAVGIPPAALISLRKESDASGPHRGSKVLRARVDAYQ